MTHIQKPGKYQNFVGFGFKNRDPGHPSVLLSFSGNHLVNFGITFFSFDFVSPFSGSL